MTAVSILPVPGIPELREGDDLVTLILERVELEDRDVVVIAQKAISKIEGRVVRLDDLEPSDRAIDIAAEGNEDPRRIEAILGIENWTCRRVCDLARLFYDTEMDTHSGQRPIAATITQGAR